MLLAAGRGERLRPLTDTAPKALVEVNGVSLLERHLRQLSAAGVVNVVINTGWLGEKIVERVGSGRQYGLQVVYSPEYAAQLETGGGVHRALPLLGTEPFWVVNTDIVCDRPFAVPALAEDIDAQLVLVPNPGYRDNGDFSLEAGRVRNGSVRPYTFSGIACYRPRFFAGCTQGRFGLAPMLQQAADEGRLSGEVYDGLWADIGTPERLAALRTRLQEVGSDGS